MIGNPPTMTQIPSQRLFGTKAAARYLGLHEQTLRKLTAEGLVPSRRLGCRRVYLLDDLDHFIAGLPSWYGSNAVPGQKGAADG
jgi:excisionase family DNA binding protein